MDMRAIIADDEQILRGHLKRLLGKIWPELEICAEAENGEAALEAIHLHQPDFAFLDIRMPGLSGMEVAEKIGDSCRVVFVTAYDQYAVKAFKHHAVDYLIKPLTEGRLQQTVSRLKKASPLNQIDLASMLRQFASNLPAESAQTLQWVRALQGDSVQMIHVDDVHYFKAGDKYTIVHTYQDEHIIRTPLKQLEASLNNDHFWRIHRNTIVNVRQIESIERHFAGKLTVRLKQAPDELTVSRSFAHLFQQM